MNVAELKKMLEKYPDDMEIIHTYYSDYDSITEEKWSVLKAVHTDNGWIMRSHPTMSEEHKLKEKEYLYLEGL